jgi:hypothetical protein
MVVSACPSDPPQRTRLWYIEDVRIYPSHPAINRQDALELLQPLRV